MDAILDSGNNSTLLLPLEFADKLSLVGAMREIGVVVPALAGSQCTRRRSQAISRSAR